jgi:hypothetical protein
MGLWEFERQPPQPFMWLEMNMVRVEGVKLPNDRRFLQSMLQVSVLHRQKAPRCDS